MKKKASAVGGGRAQEVLRGLENQSQKIRQGLAEVRWLEQRWNALASFTTPETLDVASQWLAAQVRRVGAKGCVFGASGGVDSTLVALLLHRALPTQSLALVMPGLGSSQDEKDARQLLTCLQLPHRTFSLADATQRLARQWGHKSGDKNRALLGNLTSRLRNAALYFVANQENLLVVGTGNLDETYVGYSSKGTAADLFPITGLHKQEVRALVKLALAPLNPTLAKRLSQRAATPGYWKGQRAEQELGLPYADIGRALDLIIQHCSIEQDGVVPKDPGQFAKALANSTVPAQHVLDVANLVSRGFHKSFASPALWRPA